jgi:hypothetical protein
LGIGTTSPILPNECRSILAACPLPFPFVVESELKVWLLWSPESAMAYAKEDIRAMLD